MVNNLIEGEINAINEFLLIYLQKGIIRKQQYKVSVRIMTQFQHKLISQARKTKGYLHKKSNNTFSTWKKKYFIFMKESLTIFNDETLQSSEKAISFDSIREVNAMEGLIIEIRLEKKVYFLKAQCSTDQDLWIASINILRQNYVQCLKSTKKTLSSSHSFEKGSVHQSMEKKSMASSMKSIEHVNTGQKGKSQGPSGRVQQKQKITYLLREKQLSKLLVLLGLQKLSMVTKQQKYLKRILFIEDKKNGIYFSLSSKSIYPIIDGDLVLQDFIYPYQLNVLYFLPIDTYKYAVENKIHSIKLQQLCKSSEILQSSLVSNNTIRLNIHCLKPILVQVKQLSQTNVAKLNDCLRKAAQVGKQYWSPKGKLLKNIDELILRYQQNQGNQIVFYKIVQTEFQNTVNRKHDPQNLLSSGQKTQTNVTQSHLNKLQSLTSSLKTFCDACDIKSPPLPQLKKKYVRLFHKFVYNHLNQNWTSFYNSSTDCDLVAYSKKVYNYYIVVGQVYNDQRVKQGCKTLVKIVLGRFLKAVQTLVMNFSNIEQEACRILKKVEFATIISGKQQQQSSLYVNKLTEYHIFYSTFCTNLFSLISTHFHSLSQLPKCDELLRLSWTTMSKIIKNSLQKLSCLVQSYKQRSSLISVTNSLRAMRNKRLNELLQEINQSILVTCKKEKEEFIKQINCQIALVETFCIKKLFVITFSTIDKELLKHQIPNIDFGRICLNVIEQIIKLEYILPDVRVTMFQSAFEEVCYFFYICVVKYDNRHLSKDQSLAMINQKMLAIRDSFVNKVEEDKIHSLLKDLNLLKQFITCPIHMIKSITGELKKVFGSNFTELNLKNLITLRASALKQKQYLFEECREEIKTSSSYNSKEELDSFAQRQSFLNYSTSRRQRVSTLTQSLQSYTEHFDHMQSKPKKERTVLFGAQNSLYEGYMFRKKIIKNISKTSYSRLFYRLKKGKLFEYDNEFCEDILNCYVLERLKKCYPEPEKNQCFYLQFDKETVKFKLSREEDASNWILNILDAMEEHQSMLELNQLSFSEDGALFQDLSKKISFQTKQTQQLTCDTKNQLKMIKKNTHKSPQYKLSLISPKKTQNISPVNSNNKKTGSPSKLKAIKQKSKQDGSQLQRKKMRSRQKKGCGTGCNFF